jgi:membrane fusion protein, copper/silver efflux system
MNTPNPITEFAGSTWMARRKLMRRLALVVVPLLLAVAGVWSVAQGRGHEAAAHPAGDHAGHGAAAADDPHAGHDMHAGHDIHAGHDMQGMITADGAVHLEPETARSLGITVVEAELAPLQRTIRTTGNVTYDESRLTTVTPKIMGFVERLHVDFIGQAVRRGQPLLEIYSPELVAAQEELLAAVRMERQLRASASPAVTERSALLVEAARRRLLLWDVSPAQVRQIEERGETRRTLTLHAPYGGFVIEKMVQAGQAVEAGMPLYRLADLSGVWVEADVYEQDLRFVRLGETVQVEIAAYPGESLPGRVSYVYPEVRMETRTARVRVALPNRDGRIKPGMFATVTIETPAAERAVTVPRDAVMHSGTHAMVFVEEGAGLYRAREVRVGVDVGGRTQILSGLLAGERIVNRANFLLDSESRLMESMGASPHMNH